MRYFINLSYLTYVDQNGHFLAVFERNSTTLITLQTRWDNLSGYIRYTLRNWHVAKKYDGVFFSATLQQHDIWILSLSQHIRQLLFSALGYGNKL